MRLALARACAWLALLGLLGCPPAEEVPGPALSLAPAELSFLEVVRGHPATRTVEVWNSGEHLLEIEDLVLQGEGYSMRSPLLEQGLLGPGEGGWIEVTFDPVADEPSIGTLTVRSTDPVAPSRKIAIQGVGVSADIQASPASLQFEVGHVSDVQEQTVALRSVGDAPLTLEAVEIVGGGDVFSIELIDVQPGPGTQLEPSQEAHVTVRFQPPLEVDASASLMVLSDDPQAPLLVVPLYGPAVNSNPRCGIAEAPAVSVPEGTKIDLAAWTADGQQPASTLWAEWWDQGPQVYEPVFAGAPDEGGRVEVSHVITGVGPHTLYFDVYDDDGGWCTKQVALTVGANELPQVSILQPEMPPDPVVFGAGICIEFWGFVDDEESGYELPVEWSSTHPQAPSPLTSAVADEDGFHHFEICDLPCGQQTIELTTWDDANQAGVDTVNLDVQVGVPTLDPIPDQAVVLGQVVQIPLVAQSSCGVPPQLSVTGAPPAAVLNGALLTYTPQFVPGDNPVGEVFEIEVHAEITHGNHTATDDTSFLLEVVSDEFVAISGDEPDEVLLAFNDYDGGWLDEVPLALPFPAVPRSVLDLDGDGAHDLLLADELGGAWALLRQGDGGFVDVPLAMALDGPSAVGDADGDGRIDVVVLDPLLGATTYRNATTAPGQPDFDEVPLALDLSAVAPHPDAVLAATLVDHDGDGRDDLAVTFFDEAGSALYVALASGVEDGVFGAPQWVVEAPPSRALAHGVLDGDGLVDLLAGGADVGDPGQAYRLAGTGVLGFGPAEPLFDVRPGIESGDLDDGEVAAGESRFLPTDVDHDGCTDLVVVYVSYLDPTGQDTVLSVGTVLQQFDGVSTCLGLFGDGGGDDAPDVLLVTTAPAEVAAPDGL